jgi:hypothetical protein
MICLRAFAVQCAPNPQLADRWQDMNWAYRAGHISADDLRLTVGHIDRKLMAAVLAKLRSGEYQASGFRFGETARTSLPRDWWRQYIDVDLFAGTVKWNNVCVNGLEVDIGTSVSDKPVSHDMVARLLEDHARKGKLKIKKPEALCYCMRDLKVNQQTALYADDRLPRDLRYSAGEHEK